MFAAVSVDGTGVEEQAAADVTCAVGDVVSWERLKRRDSVPTPDFRFQLADGRVAHVEVTMHTDGAARSFRHQLSEERDGKGKAGNGRYARVWPFKELAYLWTVRAADPSPFTNQGQSVFRFVKQIRDVLAEVELSGGTPSEMRQRANLEFEIQRLYNDDSVETHLRRHARVHKDPEHRGAGDGAVRTHAVIEEGFVGELGALRQAISDCASHKADKAQFGDAPGERWLAVVLDGTLAWWQFMDHFGPEAPADPPDLTDLTHEYFDEIWIVSRASPPPSYVALRLIKRGMRQERQQVRRSEA